MRGSTNSMRPSPSPTSDTSTRSPTATTSVPRRSRLSSPLGSGKELTAVTQCTVKNLPKARTTTPGKASGSPKAPYLCSLAVTAVNRLDRPRWFIGEDYRARRQQEVSIGVLLGPRKAVKGAVGAQFRITRSRKTEAPYGAPALDTSFRHGHASRKRRSGSATGTTMWISPTGATFIATAVCPTICS